MKRALPLIFILFSCGQPDVSKEKSAQAIKKDSVSLTLDNFAFTRKDTFLEAPDGKEMVFRKLVLTNHFKHSIFIELRDYGYLPRKKYKYTRGCVEAHYDSHSKKWVENNCVDCFPVISELIELKPKQSDTFVIDDPFRKYDTINYALGYRVDKAVDKTIGISGTFIQTRNKEIKNYIR